jgi:hypothetical protein
MHAFQMLLCVAEIVSPCGIRSDWGSNAYTSLLCPWNLKPTMLSIASKSQAAKKTRQQMWKKDKQAPSLVQRSGPPTI